MSLVVIDPISAYLGGIDSHNTAQVRTILLPLTEMAARHGVAIIAVTHVNKSLHPQALMKITGSLALAAAARAVWIVAKDREQKGVFLFLPVKNNLASATGGYSFAIGELSAIVRDSPPR